MELHDYQIFIQRWILDHPYCGPWLDMGLGKTVSTLSAIDALIHIFGDADKFLIIAPLTVAKETWSAEIEKWPFLKHLTYSKVLGSPKQRIAALEKEADIYLINRENVVWLVDYYKTKWPFENVVIDELSSFKSSKAKRFRALKKVRPKIKRLIGLTGTPAPNSLIDLWPQMYLIDRGQRLETSKTRYTDKYFLPDKRDGHIVYSYKLKEGSEDIIYNQISDVCVSMRAKDHLNLPPRTDNIIQVEIPMDKYKALERDMILEFVESGQTLTATNAAVLSNKFIQLANGAIYDDDKQVHVIHDKKLDALERIVEDSQGQPILVYYWFKHDLMRLKARFPQAEEFTTVDRWNSGQVPILLAHPQSMGHGLNLQKGGHIIVWFSLTWSPEFYQQANARLDRQGQQEPVIIHHLVATGTEDEKAIARLGAKQQGQDSLMDSVKAKIREICG